MTPLIVFNLFQYVYILVLCPTKGQKVFIESIITGSLICEETVLRTINALVYFIDTQMKRYVYVLGLAIVLEQNQLLSSHLSGVILFNTSLLFVLYFEILKHKKQILLLRSLMQL